MASKIRARVLICIVLIVFWQILQAGCSPSEKDGQTVSITLDTRGHNLSWAPGIWYDNLSLHTTQGSISVKDYLPLDAYHSYSRVGMGVESQREDRYLYEFCGQQQVDGQQVYVIATSNLYSRNPDEPQNTRESLYSIRDQGQIFSEGRRDQRGEIDWFDEPWLTLGSPESDMMTFGELYLAGSEELREDWVHRYGMDSLPVQKRWIIALGLTDLTLPNGMVFEDVLVVDRISHHFQPFPRADRPHFQSAQYKVSFYAKGIGQIAHMFWYSWHDTFVDGLPPERSDEPYSFGYLDQYYEEPTILRDSTVVVDDDPFTSKIEDGLLRHYGDAPFNAVIVSGEDIMRGESKELRGWVWRPGCNDDVTFVIRRGSPNMTDIVVFINDNVGLNWSSQYFSEASTSVGFNEWGDLLEGYYLQLTLYDLDLNGTKELIVSVGNKSWNMQTTVFQYTGIPEAPFSPIGTIDGQEYMWLDDGKMVAPYGSQGLFEVYDVQDGEIVRKDLRP